MTTPPLLDYAQRTIRWLRGHPSPSQEIILRALSGVTSVQVSALVKLVDSQLSPATVHRELDGLERLGWVSVDRSGLRAVLREQGMLTITPLGRSALALRG